MQERAAAKLNLFLHILGRRADGYHALESLVVFTDLTDTLEVSPADALSLTIDGEFASQVTANEDNLVLRAARLLASHCGVTHGAALTLNKTIPIGAGLGGGSADAAATLRLLNRFWKCGLSESELTPLARPLGADVPMCVMSRSALARGIGDELSLCVTPPLHAVLVYPQRPLATAAVYGMYEGEPRNFTAWPWVDFDAGLAATHNDLQRAAIALMPEVAEVLLALNTSPHTKLVRMTGSGSCCFAITDAAASATSLAATLARDYPHWWVRVVTTSA